MSNEVDPKDLLYVRFRAYQRVINGNEYEAGDYLEICNEGDIGDDGEAAIPFIQYDPLAFVPPADIVSMASTIHQLQEMLVFAMKGDFQPWEFAAHVMNRGGTGDVGDCVSFLQKQMAKG